MAANISNIYQFKITLKGPKPKVWRRIQVPENYNFYDLHVAIQDAMGWADCHLHKFEMINSVTKKNSLIGIPDKMVFPSLRPEKTAKIAQYFVSPNIKANYEYDFGIGWEHEILLEKILPAISGAQYPKCFAGRTVCPLEDGGPPSDEEEEEEEEVDIQPVKFNPKSVKFSNPENRWKNAFKDFNN